MSDYENRDFMKKARMIVASLAFSAGILIASIGGIIFLSSTAKLIFFPGPSYVVDYEEQCRFQVIGTPNYPKLKEVQTEPQKEISKEELEKCVEKHKTQDEVSSRRRKLQSLVDALSSLIVGLLLIFSFRKVVFSKKEK